MMLSLNALSTATSIYPNFLSKFGEIPDSILDGNQHRKLASGYLKPYPGQDTVKFGTSCIEEVLKLSTGDQLTLSSENPDKPFGIMELTTMSPRALFFQFTPNQHYPKLKHQALAVPNYRFVRLEGEQVSLYRWKYVDGRISLNYPSRFKHQGQAEHMGLEKTEIDGNRQSHPYLISQGGVVTFPDDQGSITILKIEPEQLTLKIKTPAKDYESVTLNIRNRLKEVRFPGYNIFYKEYIPESREAILAILCSSSKKPDYDA